MKVDVSYTLDNCVRDEIIKVKCRCQSLLVNADIFLFGSIAKGKYKKDSDIDILILIEDDKTLKELRILRHNLEDCVDTLKLNRDVDIKIYNKNRYLNLSKIVGFEQAIFEDLIDIREW